MKKLFGEINLTWKKLIIFSILTGIYTAVMATLPITEDTSFRDIAIQFEAWILFGIIIVCNSKSPKDSALKCFVFFLISQPLIYLLQVPFSSQGWHIFSYYGYWFKWTLACLPMGFIGYYIKRNNILSLIIILPALFLLTILGLGYLNQAITNFPHHLLSAIFCFALIITIILNIFDKTKLKIAAFSLVTISVIAYSLIRGGIVDSRFEVVKSLDSYNLSGQLQITTFTATKHGDAELIKLDDSYNVKLSGIKGGNYTFEITDNQNKTIPFEYYFDKNKNEVILIKKN